jgi:hypothetical protein
MKGAVQVHRIVAEFVIARASATHGFGIARVACRLQLQHKACVSLQMYGQCNCFVWPTFALSLQFMKHVCILYLANVQALCISASF